MSKALSDLEDFFDGMVGDDPGFFVVCDAIEYIQMIEGENKHYCLMIRDHNLAFDAICNIAEKGRVDDD